MSTKALETYLKPIQKLLDDQDINEIIINEPGTVWVEKKSAFSKHLYPELTFQKLLSTATLIAEFTHQEISQERPLLSATLPEGYRVQVVIPPACGPNKFVMSIRRQTLSLMSFEDYKKTGVFNHVNENHIDDSEVKKELKELYKAGNYDDFTEAFIRNKITFMVSGGTNTGKTYFLNQCIGLMNKDERLVTIEDALELITRQENVSRLFYSRGNQGISAAGPQELLASAFRLRPDRIIFGELRGVEALDFLQGANSGHEGSGTSVHADSPSLAYNKVALMIMQSGLRLGYEEVLKYIKSVVPIVVQKSRRATGERYVSGIYYHGMDQE